MPFTSRFREPRLRGGPTPIEGAAVLLPEKAAAAAPPNAAEPEAPSWWPYSELNLVLALYFLFLDSLSLELYLFVLVGVAPLMFESLDFFLCKRFCCSAFNFSAAEDNEFCCAAAIWFFLLSRSC